MNSASKSFAPVRTLNDDVEEVDTQSRLKALGNKKGISSEDIFGK
jgi:hypothetical protein